MTLVFLALTLMQDGGNIAELFPEQSYQLIAVGELRAGADEADHDLAAVRAPAQEDVPHEALAALLRHRAGCRGQRRRRTECCRCRSGRRAAACSRGRGRCGGCARRKSRCRVRRPCRAPTGNWTLLR